MVLYAGAYGTLFKNGVFGVLKMQFIPVKMELKPRIDAITKSWGEGSCQHSFVTMYALQEKYGDSVYMEDGMLYVSRDHLSDGRFRTCLMPMGAGSIRDAVERLLEDTHSRGMKLKLFPDRDWAEYLYSSRKLVELNGSELAGKRRSIRLFYRDLPGKAEVLPLTPEIAGEVESFHERWLVENKLTHDAAALERELRSVRLLLGQQRELGVMGFVVTVDGGIRGYCFGAPLSQEVFDAIIMKGDRDVRHLYAFMYQELGRLGSCCEYINFEEDLGIAGLRECKLSYRPDRMLNKFCAEEL